jgi:segregation and condensation protein A
MELVRRLLEYRKFKEAAGQLREMEIAQSLVYSREPLDLTPFLPQARENPVRGLHIVDLLISFQKMMKQAARRNAVATIRRDEISVQDRIEEIVSILQFREEPLLFSDLLLTDWTREEVIVTFLAVLELMKMKRIQCYQHGLFDDIVIVYRGEGSGDDIISTVETGD